MGDNNFIFGSRSKLECDDVWVPFLGCDLENGSELVSVFDSGPPGSVRELSQH